MGWNKDWPTDTVSPCASVTQIRDNWEALESWFNTEHAGVTGTNAGKHPQGLPVVLVTSTEPTGGVVGALAFTKHDSTLKLRRSSGWSPLTEYKFSRIRNVAASASISTNDWTLVTTWNSTAASGLYDTLSEWGNNRFTAKGSGFYLVTAHTRWERLQIKDYNKTMGLFKNNTLHTKTSMFSRFKHSLYLYDVVYLNAGDTLHLMVKHSHPTPVLLLSANIHIQRIS